VEGLGVGISPGARLGRREEAELAREFLAWSPAAVVDAPPREEVWLYGFGGFGEAAGRVKGFRPLPFWTGERNPSAGVIQYGAGEMWQEEGPDVPRGTLVLARQILMARRLVERGVRFVQVYTGAVGPWDSHDDLEVDHRRLARESDQAMGAILLAVSLQDKSPVGYDEP
jgi:hypothetical protein